MTLEFREIVETDFEAILKLNDAEVKQTSPLDADSLRSLVLMSAHSSVVTLDGEVAAFLIALREGTSYASENYRWFVARLPRFLYVDRVVVDARFSGCGIGSRLYADLFAFARTQEVDTVTCEYNLVPPNPASRAFHAKHGFCELGTQWVAGGSKRVSLQAAKV